MKSSARTSFASTLVLGALSLHLAGCASEVSVEDNETSMTASALTAIRTGTRGDVSEPGKLPVDEYIDRCYPPPRVLGFAPTSGVISLGESTTLSWNVEVANGCAYTVELFSSADAEVTIVALRAAGPPRARMLGHAT